MSKTSEDKINFRQYLLAKQIIESTINIDKQIDIEINKIQNKLKEKRKNLSKRRGVRRNSVVKMMNTFIINNKGSIIDGYNYTFLEEENKKNIIVELQSVKDFYAMLENIKNSTENLIKNKDSQSQ